MKAHKESIFRSMIKRFIGSFASVFGFFIALSIFFTVIALSMKKTQGLLPYVIPMKVHLNKEGAILPLQKSSPLILQINIEGPIGKFKDSTTTSEELQKIFNQPALYGINKDRIKGIFLHINSPGGAATESDEMYQDIMTFKKEHDIPVHVWIGDMCASGGYYLACTGDYISAQTISIIGSVGVRSRPNFNFYNLMEKIGVEQRTIAIGKDKVHFPMFSPFSKGTTSYDDIIKIMEGIYNRFLNIVVAARGSHGLTKDKLIEYGATVYGSDDAQKLGYIDAAGVRYNEAVENLAKTLQIDDSSYQVISFHRNPSLSQLMQAKIESMSSFFCNDKHLQEPFSLEAEFMQ